MLTAESAKPNFYIMTFKQAVKCLGGPSKVAALSGVARTVIIYWLEHGVSRFRKADEEKIIALARAQHETDT